MLLLKCAGGISTNIISLYRYNRIVYSYIRYSHTCWKCGTSISPSTPSSTSSTITTTTTSTIPLFCVKQGCNAIQEISRSQCNYFTLFNIKNTSFAIDEKQLEHVFKDLQKVFHPDKYATKSNEEKHISSVNSSLINEAYQVMKSPIERARYILNLNNIKILDEENKTYDKEKVLDPLLMIEMFEIREKIEEAADDNNELLLLQNDLEMKIQKVNTDLQDSLQNKNLSALTNAAVRLKYLSKALDEVNEVIKS